MAIREVRCEACGTVNRVPRYVISRTPQCGKCHAKLKETVWIRSLRAFHALPIGLLLLVPIIVFLSWVTLIRPAPTNAPTAPECVAIDRPPQGVYRDHSFAPRVAPFTISTAAGSDYLVKLEDETNGILGMSFYVRGGSSITETVPLGNFILKYAAGRSWCGERDLFGPDTATKQADDLFSVDQSTHWTIELILQPGGNLKTHSIPRSRF
jgi:hypothetical protein